VITLPGYGPKMTNNTRRWAALVFAFLVTFLGGAGISATASQPAQSTVAIQPTAAVACGDTSGFKQTPLSTLPPEATDTYNLIQQGGPYPYPQDDTVFDNREGLLPSCSSGYYHEYTVKTPGSPDRGARRIVAGSGGEYFYTGDHYASFSVIPAGS
jgi:guanyl-specific ribonuclease Sa